MKVHKFAVGIVPVRLGQSHSTVPVKLWPHSRNLIQKSPLSEGRLLEASGWRSGDVAPAGAVRSRALGTPRDPASGH